MPIASTPRRPAGRLAEGQSKRGLLLPDVDTVVTLPAIDRDVTALRREAQGNRAANATATARDDGDFVLQTQVHSDASNPAAGRDTWVA